jgi:hypothetical protein
MAKTLVGSEESLKWLKKAYGRHSTIGQKIKDAVEDSLTWGEGEMELEDSEAATIREEVACLQESGHDLRWQE